MDIYSFILENKELVASLLVLLITFIQLLVLLFKKKVVVTSSIKESILSKLPVVIMTAEKIIGPGLGADKKKFVFQEIIEFISKEYNVSSSFVINNFSKFINYHLEEILCTPQAKEVI